ncbi:MAG: hypothetical protein QOD55_882 [Solirubrobacteraceae bacterium]|jgi:hypothetical protein|nr:hypothetical protein [Solirubrobacteraceae bacterium]MEA2288885.1 hypothetical protein [Solirubrobacteraceae bacterium]
MPAPDPALEALRVRLDAALTGRERLGAEDLRALISSWELMRRALSNAPPPQLAIDTHEVPHTLWYRGGRRAALDAATDGTVLEGIDGRPQQPAVAESVEEEQERKMRAARDLAANWEAHHGPLPPTARGAGRSWNG